MPVTLDLMEWPSDAEIQAAYPSSDVATDVKDFYSESNRDTDLPAWRLHPTSDAYKSALGQAFTTTSTFKIGLCKLYMKKAGSPTGTGYARLYAVTGTVGVDAKPTGAVLASSDGFDVTTLTTSLALITLTFSGADQYELQDATDYCIVFENPTEGNFGSVNHTVFGVDGSSPAHGGNLCHFTSSAWASSNAYDTCFYIYDNIPHLQCHSESIIVKQGTYSLEGIAKTIGSLNDTLTRTVDPTIDLSNQNAIEFWIRSSRTGQNIKIGIHDAGGTTTEITPNILSANTWQKVVWNISAVANADKDAIDSIIITIVNAD